MARRSFGRLEGQGSATASGTKVISIRYALTTPERPPFHPVDRTTHDVSMTSRSHIPGLWPLLALNFFMADMQSGVGPFVGVFLQERGWASGLVGTALTTGNAAGMLITTPIGGFIDSSRNKRMWVVIPGICVVAASAIILISQNFWAVTASQIAQSLASAAIVPAVTGITLGIVKQSGFNQQKAMPGSASPADGNRSSRCPRKAVARHLAVLLA